MRQCPFDGCAELIPPFRFACLRHWRSLLRTEQDEIWAAWRAYKKGDIRPDELRRRQLAVLDSAYVRGVT